MGGLERRLNLRPGLSLPGVQPGRRIAELGAQHALVRGIKCHP